MSDNPADKSVLGSKALEIVMRDVLYGMEDLTSAMGYHFNSDHFKIVSIERLSTPDGTARETGVATEPCATPPAKPGAEVISLLDRLARSPGKRYA